MVSIFQKNTNRNAKNIKFFSKICTAGNIFQVYNT